MFVNYFLPRIKRVFRVFKDAGLPVQMHSCGKITPFIPHLIDAGLDVLEPLQNCMDFQFLKNEYGKDLTFYWRSGIRRICSPSVLPGRYLKKH